MPDTAERHGLLVRLALAALVVAATGTVLVYGTIGLFLAVEQPIARPVVHDTTQEMKRSTSMELSETYVEARGTVCTMSFGAEDCTLEGMNDRLERRSVDDYGEIRPYFRDAGNLAYLAMLRGLARERFRMDSPAEPVSRATAAATVGALYDIQTTHLYATVRNATDACRAEGMTAATCFRTMRGVIDGHADPAVVKMPDACPGVSVDSAYRAALPAADGSLHPAAGTFAAMALRNASGAGEMRCGVNATGSYLADQVLGLAGTTAASARYTARLTTGLQLQHRALRRTLWGEIRGP